MAVKTHDFKNWTHAAGVSQLQGFGPDAGVQIEFVSDDYDSDVGSDGEVTVYALHDKRATLTVTTTMGSATNTLLSGLRQANLLATDGTGFFSWLSQDRNSLSKFTGRLCVIKKAPPLDIKESHSPVVWTILVMEGDLVVAGKSAL